MPLSRIILSLMISEDGFIADSQRKLDWVRWTPEMDVAALVLLKQADMFFAGHNAFRDMAAYWPSVLEGNESSVEERAYAKVLCDLPKGVIGRPDGPQIWDEQVAIDAEKLGHSLQKLPDTFRTIIVYGGARTAQRLISEDLVDELHLFVSPVSIQQGHPLFASGDMRRSQFKEGEVERFASSGRHIRLDRQRTQNI